MPDRLHPRVMQICAKLARAGLDVQETFFAHAVTTPGWERLASGARCGILVGNTRALWPPFTAARAALPVLHPLDTYVERSVEEAIAGVKADVVYAHRQYAGVFLPFQHLAVDIGFGAMTDGHLVVHPEYGPWFALRAVIALDADPVELAPRPRLAKPCACITCPAALGAALADATNWRAWLAVRDACELRSYRYSDEQIAFHYAGLAGQQVTTT